MTKEFITKELVKSLQFQIDLYESLIVNTKKQIKSIKKLKFNEKEIHGIDGGPIIHYSLAPNNAVPVYTGKRVKQEARSTR